MNNQVTKTSTNIQEQLVSKLRNRTAPKATKEDGTYKDALLKRAKVSESEVFASVVAAGSKELFKEYIDAVPFVVYMKQIQHKNLIVIQGIALEDTFIQSLIEQAISRLYGITFANGTMLILSSKLHFFPVPIDVLDEVLSKLRDEQMIMSEKTFDICVFSKWLKWVGWQDIV